MPKKKKSKIATQKNSKLEKLYSEHKEVRNRQYRLDSVFRDMVAKRTGMTQTELSCVKFLMEEGETTPGELAKVTGLTTGAITGVVARLEKKGCVTSARDTKDRRKVIIRAVPKKLAPAMAYYNTLSERYYRLLATFDEDQMKFLIHKSKEVCKLLEEEVGRLEKLNGVEKKP